MIDLLENETQIRWALAIISVLAGFWLQHKYQTLIVEAKEWDEQEKLNQRFQRLAAWNKKRRDKMGWISSLVKTLLYQNVVLAETKEAIKKTKKLSEEHY